MVTISTIRQLAFGAMSLSLFGAALFVILEGGDWSAAGRGVVALVAGSFCALVAFLDRFQSLEVSPNQLRATIREAEQVVSEAQATLQQVHVLAETFSAIIINALSGVGRHDGIPPRVIEDARRDIERSLGEIGLPADAIARVLQADSKWVAIDYSNAIINKIRAREDEGGRSRLRGDELIDRWNNEGFRPSADELRSELATLGVDDLDIVELLSDYEHYERTYKHRRPDVWLARLDW
ncbi:hypothetical protein [Thalassobaculum sp.]|uniref:hypothetical protein n=1 Tax=Thalassobaculum sp. TaxID=2022740 RepID=UPI003B5BACC5